MGNSRCRRNYYLSEISVRKNRNRQFWLLFLFVADWFRGVCKLGLFDMWFLLF